MKDEEEIRNRLKELIRRKNSLYSYSHSNNIQSLYAWIESIEWVLK